MYHSNGSESVHKLCPPVISTSGRCGHRPLQKTCVFSVGGDALIAPWGAIPERSEKTDTPIPLASGPMWASAPTKNNVRFQRRGRCPHRPVGCDSWAVRENGHAHTVGPRADVGIGPYKNNVRFQRRGRCPHRPAGAVPERPERTNVPLPTSFRSNESIGLLRNKRILNVGGDAHIAPRVRHLSGSKERTCPFQRPCGSMKACAPTICNLEFPYIVIHTIAYFSFSLFTNRGNCCKIE